jgi:tRNA/rRNA methyltransferase
MHSTKKQPSIILVKPQMGENIGSAARAMLNFGLENMRVVAARDGWPSQSAVATASGAGRVLDQARHFSSFHDAVGDCHFVFATTARCRDLAKPVYDPKKAMKIAFEKISDGQNVGIIFGPERAGLENTEVVRSNALITVPVNPNFSSINLAQTVLLLSYEWFLAADIYEKNFSNTRKTSVASILEIEKLSDQYENELEKIGFFFPEEKATSMKSTLRNIWSRLPLTVSDVRAFHGILRHLLKRRNL